MVREAWLQAKSACAAPGATAAGLKKAVRRFMSLSEKLRKKQDRELQELRQTLATLSEELAREKIAEKEDAARHRNRERERKRKRPAEEPAAARPPSATSQTLKLCVSPFDTSWKNPRGER